MATVIQVGMSEMYGQLMFAQGYDEAIVGVIER